MFGMTLSRTDEDGLVGDLGAGGHVNRGVDAEQRPAIQLFVNEVESLKRGGCRTRSHHSRIVSESVQYPAKSRRGQHFHTPTVVADAHSPQLVIPQLPVAEESIFATGPVQRFLSLIHI